MDSWDPLDHPARIEVRRQDSDDSDADGGLGNVTRVVLRPPGHSGKAKRGHLSFDASFETGNLGRVDFISEFEYDLFIRPDTCNPRYRIWFNFVVDNVRGDQRVLFNIVNFSKTKTLFCNGMTPLIRTTSRPKWQRLGEKYVYYHKSPEHRNHYVLSFVFIFDREEDVYQFAFTFPYSFARAEIHLRNILQKNLPFVSVQNIAISLHDRKVDALTICNPQLQNKKSKVVVIMARAHPGESPTSFVAQGLLDFLISNHPLAIVLRDHVIIKVIPMVNPDGVFNGNHRTSLMGYDLNRHWNQISPWSHPVLSALKSFFQELDANKEVELDIILDFHAHTSLLGAFIYGNSYEDVYRFERHILFPKLLAHHADDYNPTYTMYNRDANKIGTARRHLCDTLRSSVNVYTLEVSVYGYIQHNHNGTTSTVPYSEDGYFRLGRNIVRTLAEYYRVTGIILANAFPVTTPTNANIQGNEDDRKRIVRRSRSRSQPPTIGKEKAGSVDTEETGRAAVLQKSVKLSVDEENDGDGDDEEDPEPASSFDKDADSNSLSSRDSSCHGGRSESRNALPNNEVQIYSEETPKINSDGQRLQFHKSQSDNPLKKFAYRTFDFSLLNSGLQKQYINLGSGQSSSNSSGGRKVGGGGVMGKRKTQRARMTSSKWSMELGKMDPPSLTIIDFNLLILKGLEHRIEVDVKDQLTPKHKNLRDKRDCKTFFKYSDRIPRQRSRRIRGIVTDWENTSGSDDDDVQRSTPIRTRYHHSAPAPLNSQSGIRNEKMVLNPREPIRKPRKE